MSFVEKLSKDKARNILFFTSLSVILITLGIIQTLLFETITFFSEIAAERGWFTFTIAIGDIFSAQGLAFILFMLLAYFELKVLQKPSTVQKLPYVVLFPSYFAIFVIILVVSALFLIFESILLSVSILFVMLVWRRSVNRYIQSQVGVVNPHDRSFGILLILLGVISLFTATTSQYGGAFGEFFLQSQWTPTGACSDRRSLCENMSFGVNSLLLTTIQVAFGALIIAVPLGVGCAIYLSEYASPKLVAIVKPTLEILAGIPSVVYGFFAFIYIGPIVVSIGDVAFANGWIDQPPNILNPINGAIVVGIMILPLVASMSEDALRAVPNELREGSLALGATRIETTLRVMIQASLSGILASIILALSRAVGETMAVTLAVGTVAVYTSNMFLPAQTMTAYIAQRVGGDLPFGEIGYLTIFAVGLYLFMITLFLNLLGNKVLSTYREAY